MFRSPDYEPRRTTAGPCALQDDLEEGSDSDDDVGSAQQNRVGPGSDMLLSV